MRTGKQETNRLTDRLKESIGRRSYSEVSRVTGFNPETVRRYFHRGSPSVEFIQAVCQAFDIDANWLLMGEGAKRGARDHSRSLAETRLEELLAVLVSVARKADQDEPDGPETESNSVDPDPPVPEIVVNPMIPQRYRSPV